MSMRCGKPNGTASRSCWARVRAGPAAADPGSSRNNPCSIWWPAGSRSGVRPVSPRSCRWPHRGLPTSGCRGNCGMPGRDSARTWWCWHFRRRPPRNRCRNWRKSRCIFANPLPRNLASNPIWLRPPPIRRRLPAARFRPAPSWISPTASSRMVPSTGRFPKAAGRFCALSAATTACRPGRRRRRASVLNATNGIRRPSMPISTTMSASCSPRSANGSQAGVGQCCTSIAGKWGRRTGRRAFARNSGSGAAMIRSRIIRLIWATWSAAGPRPSGFYGICARPAAS